MSVPLLHRRLRVREERPMNRRDFLGVSCGGLGGVLAARAEAFARPRLDAAPAATGGETLYNGIKLPTPWPPKVAEVPRDPVTPPYLKSPPAVIPIEAGRQLFVDD